MKVQRILEPIIINQSGFHGSSLAASAAIFAAWIGVQRAVPWVTTLSCLGHQALQGGPRKPVLNGVTWVAL